VIQRKVGEQILHDKGLSRRDIHGVDRDTVTVRKRHDFAATLRRACAACGRRRLRRALSVGAVAQTLVAAYTASHVAAMVLVALWVAVGVVHEAPDVVFEAPAPAYERSNTQSDGMTDREVMERLAIVKERSEYKQELIDDKVDDAKADTNTPTVRNMR